MYVVVVPALLLVLAKKTEVSLECFEGRLSKILTGMRLRGSTSLEGSGKGTLYWNTRRDSAVDARVWSVHKRGRRTC